MSCLKKETPPGGLNSEPKKRSTQKKKGKSPWRAKLGAKNKKGIPPGGLGKKGDVAFEKKRKSPWRAKLGAKKRKQKRLKQKKHDQVKAMSKHQKQSVIGKNRAS